MHPTEFEENTGITAKYTTNYVKQPAILVAFKTPQTLRHIDVGWRYVKADLKFLSPEIAYSESYEQFERPLAALETGSKALVVEYNEVSSRLKALEKAQKKKRQAKQRKNWHLQAGGVLQADKARAMVVEREEDELLKAQRKVEKAQRAAVKLEERHQIDSRIKSGKIYVMHAPVGVKILFL